MNVFNCYFEIENSWKKVLDEEFHQPYIAALCKFVENERLGAIPIYPPKSQVFNAFLMTPYSQVKVVIMGQDPYHAASQAHGLSFSVPKGVTPPPSLKNIFKEMHQDLGLNVPVHGCLNHWATQGVLLLNATLTVKEGCPLSHHGKGWERFTDAVIAKLIERIDPVIFVLWGRSANEKIEHIKSIEGNNRHYILSAAHPSPFSAYRGFFGCRHFSKINEILKMLNKTPIDWML